MANITIIGAGMMGSAMCWPAVDNGHTVTLVGTPLDHHIISEIQAGRDHPTLVRQVPGDVTALDVSHIPQAVKDADLVICGVSSFGVDWFAHHAIPHLSPQTPVISVTKGLEDQANGDLVPLPSVLAQKAAGFQRSDVSFNAIGGPCIAHELAARRQTTVVFCGTDLNTLKDIRTMLATPYYHPWLSTDVVGVEACAALKNAYALAVGIAVGMMEQAGPDGLAHMYNPQAALFGQSCYEMDQLLKILSGGASNVPSLPGAGDLYVTVFGGRTLRLGKLLGQNKSFTEARQILSGVTLESVEIVTRVARALPKLAARGLASLSDFPLLLMLNAVINEAQPVDIPWHQFFHQAFR